LLSVVSDDGSVLVAFSGSLFHVPIASLETEAAFVPEIATIINVITTSTVNQ